MIDVPVKESEAERERMSGKYRKNTTEVRGGEDTPGADLGYLEKWLGDLIIWGPQTPAVRALPCKWDFIFQKWMIRTMIQILVTLIWLIGCDLELVSRVYRHSEIEFSSLEITLRRWNTPWLDSCCIHNRPHDTHTHTHKLNQSVKDMSYSHDEQSATPWTL